MSVFKINLRPINKDRGFEIRYIRAGRIAKQCAVCQKKIGIGKPSTTFLNRKSEGLKTSYNTLYTCGGNAHDHCTQTMAKQLDLELP